MHAISKINDRQKVLDNPLGFLCFKNANIELVEIILKQNESIPMHYNTVHVIFYVVEGEGELQIGTQSFHLKAAEIAEIHPDEERSWSNPFEKELKLLLVKLVK